MIALVAFVVIGPKRLPDVGRALGEALRAFQETLRASGTDETPKRRDDQPN